MPFPPLNLSALPGALAALLLLGMACSLALQAADWRSRLEMPSAAPERPHQATAQPAIEPLLELFGTPLRKAPVYAPAHLDWQLQASFTQSDSRQSRALIRMAGQTRRVAEGDALDHGLHVRLIAPRHVELAGHGRVIQLALQPTRLDGVQP